MKIFISPNVPFEVQKGLREVIALFGSSHNLELIPDRQKADVIVGSKRDLLSPPDKVQRLVLYLPPGTTPPRELPAGTQIINTARDFRGLSFTPSATQQAT